MRFVLFFLCFIISFFFFLFFFFFVFSLANLQWKWKSLRARAGGAKRGDCSGWLVMVWWVALRAEGNGQRRPRPGLNAKQQQQLKQCTRTRAICYLGISRAAYWFAICLSRFLNVRLSANWHYRCKKGPVSSIRVKANSYYSKVNIFGYIFYKKYYFIRNI